MYVIPISLNAVYVLTQPCICICMLMFPADVSFLMHIVRVLIASCLCVLCHIDDHIGSRYVDYEMKQIIYDDVFCTYDSLRIWTDHKLSLIWIHAACVLFERLGVIVNPFGFWYKNQLPPLQRYIGLSNRTKVLRWEQKSSATTVWGTIDVCPNGTFNKPLVRSDRQSHQTV